VALRDAVLAWGEQHLRALPWRQTRDPWRVLVSELMLQQTQVPRVVPAYRRFLERFPTAPVCAAAPQGEVIEAWQGLGYNRRARSLHRIAQAVTERHDGTVPNDLDALEALPGIGPYTARALTAFAFEGDVGVVDVNVARILSRVDGSPMGRLKMQARADELVPDGRGWLWNQVMLDLGATVCGRRTQRCSECPIAGLCAWRQGGGPDPSLQAAIRTRPQSRFEGSDRQGRARLLRALLRGPVADEDLAGVCGWPGDEDRAARVAAALVGDGLATRSDKGLLLA
jgi:A/G-specific adenine glycosylase